MKNFEVARLFNLMADVLELKAENPFRIRAYRRAAQNLESLTEDVEALARQKRLDEIPGIRRMYLETYVRYTFVRYGVPYVVAIECSDGALRFRRIGCRDADKVAVRFLKALRVDRAVDVGNRRVVILDWDRLAAIGDFAPDYLQIDIKPE